MKAPRGFRFPFGAFLVLIFLILKIFDLPKKEGTMFHRRNWITMAVVILGLAMFVPFAEAQRQEHETIMCFAETFTVVHFSPEVTIMGFDGKGITQSTHSNKLFDNFTFHFVGASKIMDGKYSSHALSKNMGPDGDFIVWEVYGDSESGMTSKPIYGTEKWKGVKGESKGKVITAGKPIAQGTLQVCQKWVGWTELPK